MLRLFFAATFLLGAQAFAQNTVDSLDGQVSQVTLQSQKVSDRLKPLQDALNAAIKARDQAKTDLDNAQKNWAATAGGFTNPITGTVYGQGSGDPALKKSLDEANKKLAAAQKIVDQDQPEVTTLNNQTKDLTKQLGKLKTNDTKANDAFVAVLRGKGLVTDFSDLKAQVGSVNSTLDKMESTVDKMALGAYLKDKMAKLLNSKALCQAEKSCGPKFDGKATLSNNDLDSALFPDTKASDREPSSGNAGHK